MWGFSGSCAQLLYMRYGVDSMWLTSVRMAIGAVVLFLIALAVRRASLFRVMKRPINVARVVFFAIAGLLLTQLTYLMLIERTNAATATVFEYIGPVIVVGFMCVRGRRLPTKNEVGAMLCVFVGTFFIATHGDPTQLVLSPGTIVFGLFAAVCVALYTIIPAGLMERFDSMSVLAWGMVIGAVSFGLFVRPWTASYNVDAAGWMYLIGGLTLVGTIGAVLTYFQGVRDIGASRASLLASFEVVSATFLAVVWLGTNLSAMDYVGIAFIMFTVVLLGNAKDPNSRPRELGESRTTR